MNKSPLLLKAKVWHLRERPKKNEFTYSVYYVAIRLKELASQKPTLFSFNRFNILSVYNQDLGKKDDTAWLPWIKEEFEKAGVEMLDTDDVEVIIHPRLFGYAFNPISYWLLLDSNNSIKAVLCEVHNTFKQAHNYVLAHDDKRPIAPTDTFTAKKQLYVSPFNTVDGYYTFTFAREHGKFTSNIFYYVGNECVVKTAMSGNYSPLTSPSILGVVVKYPLMTILVVARIHFQAVKLYFKKVRLTLDKRPKNHVSKTTVGEIQGKHLNDKNLER